MIIDPKGCLELLPACATDAVVEELNRVASVSLPKSSSAVCSKCKIMEY